MNASATPYIGQVYPTGSAFPVPGTEAEAEELARVRAEADKREDEAPAAQPPAPSPMDLIPEYLMPRRAPAPRRPYVEPGSTPKKRRKGKR